ncbi:MAG: response regulator [Lachnospiraceae bacterium]|nr:response regulator [Lachnospiraceae bacterium]
MNTESTSNNILNHLIKCTLAVFVFAAVLFYSWAQLFLPDERGQFGFKCEQFPVDWERVYDSGYRESVSVPGTTEAEPGDTVVIETKVPEALAQEGTLCIRGARQDIYVYVDDALRFSFSTKDTRAFGSTSAALYLFIRFYPEDFGKTLRVEYISNSDYSGHFRSMYYGNQAGILTHLLFDVHGAEILVGFLLLLFSMICILVCVFLLITRRRLVPLFYLALGMLAGSVWCLANSPMEQFLFPNISATAEMTFVCLLLIPLPLTIYTDTLQKARYHNLYIVYQLLSIFVTIVCAALQASNTMDFVRTFTIMFATLAIGILVILGTTIRDLATGHIRNYLVVAIGFLGLGVCGVWEMLSYLARSEQFSGTPMAIGYLILLIMAVIQAIFDSMRLERARQEAIHANQMKAEFLANMSHEIRTPMNAILGLNDIILRDTREPETRENAASIESAGKSLLALVNDILDFSKIESGKIDLLPTEYHTMALMKDCCNLIEGRAKEKNLEFRMEIDYELPTSLFGDVDRIRQIITNLLTNAVKYTKKGSVTLKFRGERDEAGRFWLNIFVTDTGIGIRPSDYDKIFGSFQRVDQDKNRSIEGTGLGLSIVKHLTTVMEGTIQVHSELEKGSQFHVRIPQGIVNATPLSANTTTSSPESFEHPAGAELLAPDARILVVDDVEMNLKVVSGLLRKSRIQIDTAISGQECLDLIRKNHYDIIFLDHMMPEMDGVETYRQMKAMEDNLNPNAPVIMLTANALAGSREQYLSIGFTDYLAKPFRYESIQALLVRYLPADLLQQMPGDND